MDFLTITLGCKVNLYETESIIAYLENKGWQYKKDSNNVDVVIINTCTVTATSDQKSRQMIRQAKRNNPKAIVVAMGCFAQTHPNDAEKLAERTIGTGDRLKIYDLVNEYIINKHKINYVIDLNHFSRYEEMKLSKLTTHTRGFVKIQDGCENFCSYCLIPYARGKIKSRKPEDVIAEIEQLVMFGTKEVIIAGINTGTYGKDLGNINLAKLIELIMTKTNLWRLRLSSIELMEVSDELLAIMKKYQYRIANHLHIPLQGGNDQTLVRMRRKYLTSDYRNLIVKIRNNFPNIAITTDCLAGFVGETEDEFEDSLAFIKEMNFANMHIFPYSRRKGTKADEMCGHLDNSIIKERAKKLTLIAKDMRESYQKKFIGQIVEVLFEQQKGVCFVGHTSNYLEIYCTNGNPNIINEVKTCLITHFEKGKLYARIEGEI